MAREEKAIFTVLCMVYDDDGNILVEDRLDPKWPGICFPGGHVEPGEAMTDAAVREVFEETGIVMEEPRLCGVKQFQTDSDARYVVFFYKSNRFSGELKGSDEGEVFWINRNQIDQYHTVPDLKEMMKVMESEDLNEFYYYKDGKNWGLRLL